MIGAENLTVRRGGRLVLDKVSLAADRNATIGIIGPNGAGKTTLLLALFRALSIDGGVVRLDDEDVTALTRRDIARRVAVVGQNDPTALPLPVRDAVALGRLPHRSLLRYGDDADTAIVEDALARVGALDLADRLVTELSGGERQRVLLARAIAQKAGHLLLDEPTNHLDIHHQFLLLDLVREVQATTIVVLHDLNLASQVCTELVLLDRGRLVASGPTAQVLDPELISRVYRVRAEAILADGHTHLVFSRAAPPPRAQQRIFEAPRPVQPPRTCAAGPEPEGVDLT